MPWLITATPGASRSASQRPARSRIPTRGNGVSPRRAGQPQFALLVVVYTGVECPKLGPPEYRKVCSDFAGAGVQHRPQLRSATARGRSPISTRNSSTTVQGNRVPRRNNSTKQLRVTVAEARPSSKNRRRTHTVPWKSRSKRSASPRPQGSSTITTARTQRPARPRPSPRP